MISEFSGTRFRVTQYFIAARSPLSGGRSPEWGFVMNTDDSGMRRTKLWERNEIYQEAKIVKVTAASELTGVEEDFLKGVYSADIYYDDRSSQVTQAIRKMLEPFPYNDWINVLCTTYDTETLLGETFEIDYPKKQEFNLKFGQLVNTQDDIDHPWVASCYPRLDLVVPQIATSLVKLSSVDMSTN